MKAFTLLVVALVALAGLVGCTTTQPPNARAGTDAVVSSQVEAAVRATLAEFANTWNHHDVQAMCELFTEDVQWIRAGGNLWRGKQSVYGGNDYDHRILNPKTGKPWAGPLNIENIEVRSLAPQVAVGMALLAFSQGVVESDQEYQGWFARGSFVMTNSGGSWRIAHFQQTQVAPEMFRSELSLAKRKKIKAGMENYQKEGKDFSAIAELMQQFDRLRKDGKFDESEAVLDKALGLLAGTAGETAQPQQTTSNAKPPEQGRKHAAELSKIASVSPNFPTVPVHIVFQNHSSGIRKVYWLDKKGERQHYRELKPGESYEQPSYLINPWVVTDADGDALGLYFPDGQKRMVTLE